ncbi:MAG: hypothetical protein ACE5LD_02185 [Candidatus Bipolaricaulia bacterium]
MTRWTARAIGTVAAALFVVMLIGSAVAEGVGPLTVESGTLVLLGAVALAGGSVSWWRDMGAGILLVLTSIGLAAHIGYYAERNHLLAWSMIGLPFLVAGLLILSSWRLSRRNR